MEGLLTTARSLATALAAATTLALVPSGASAAVPHDRAFAAQWQLTTDTAMGVRSAWALSTGGDVTVAIVDTGAQLDHPDLAANLWTNPGEIAGNGIDDDENGFVDDVHGYDFAGKDGDPSDENGHGTNVAGIVGACGNDVTGVAWSARLMIVRALGADGTGTVYDVARAIRYAVANGARIVNLSMAGPDDDPALESAIADAEAAGVLVVAAAGNSAADLDVKPAYPAASPSAAVITVASTDANGRLAPTSSFGRATVEIAAPGESINSTEPGGRYGIRSGTSQATAQITGVLALMAAAAPNAPAAELRTRLLAGAKANGLPVGTGAVDAAAAVRGILGLPAAAAPAAAPATPVPPASRRAKAAASRRAMAAASRRAMAAASRRAVRRAVARRAAGLRSVGSAPAPLSID